MITKIGFKILFGRDCKILGRGYLWTTRETYNSGWKNMGEVILWKGKDLYMRP